MPGKVNPVMLEMVYMVACQVIGNDAAITAAGMGSQLEINVMMPVIAFNLLFSIGILAQAMRVLRERCIEGITADEQRCRYYVEQSLALATSLNPLLGYEKAAEIAKQAYREGTTIREAAARVGGVDAEQLAQLLDPLRHV